MRTVFQTLIPADIILHPPHLHLHHLPPPTTAAMTITIHLTISSLMVAATVPPQSAAVDISAIHPPQKDALLLPPLTAPTKERTPDTESAPNGRMLLLPLPLPPPPLLQPLPPPPPPLYLWQQCQIVLNSRTVTVLHSRLQSISQHPVFSIHLTQPLQNPFPYLLRPTLWTRTTDCSPQLRLLLPTPFLPLNFLLRKLKRTSAQQWQQL